MIAASHPGIIVVLLLLSGCAAAPATAPPTATSQPIVTQSLSSETATPLVEMSQPTAPSETATAAGDLPLSDGNGWPVTVSAQLSGTFNDSDGSYSATGAARWCGDAFYNITLNERSFSFEFPLDTATGDVEDVTFSANDLVPGESATVFNISINVHTGAGFDPAATVVSAGQTGTADSGTGNAQLMADSTTRTLQLDASTKDGETIKLKGVCSAP
jgi:hypothetical protein